MVELALDGGVPPGVSSSVRVWIVPADVPPDAAARYQGVLDDGERSRAAAFADPADGRLFTVAHGALRILAGRELGTRPAALSWVAGQYGKPELIPPWSGVHTSLSHSAGMIAVAISSDRPVGIDIQHLAPGLDVARLSARFFPPDEADYVAAGPDPGTRADRFARLWARKEAAVKAVGGRLWPNLEMTVRDRDVVFSIEPAHPNRVADVGVPANCRAAVALAGTAPFALESFYRIPD